MATITCLEISILGREVVQWLNGLVEGTVFFKRSIILPRMMVSICISATNIALQDMEDD
jgi:hypothetical protein